MSNEIFLMPVFRSKGTFGRMAFDNAMHTPWKRWFAWYPVSDMGVTYWLIWLEWRHVRSSGWIGPDMPASSNYIEYRRSGERTDSIDGN